MYSQHPRYKEFAVKVCHGNDVYQENSILKMILFKNERKLRNHTVKHFLDADEFEKVWKKFLPDKIKSVTKYVTDLKNMGCPLPYNPPCNDCTRFEQCTPYVSEIENIYLKGIKEVIIQGCTIPRYVSFFSKSINNELFSILSDNKIILKACFFENDIFNLMTCYVKTGRRPFAEIMNNEISKISSYSDNQSIKWCNKANWGVGISIENKSKVTPPSPKSPYKRGGGASWQQYLAEMKD